MAKIIKTDGTCLPVQPSNGTDFSLKEMQAIVGGYIELVELNDTNTIVLNEEGKLNGLPLNIEATRVFRSYYPGSNDFIVGNVLICKTEQIL